MAVGVLEYFVSKWVAVTIDGYMSKKSTCRNVIWYCWRDFRGKLHRKYGPAELDFIDGKIRKISWYRHGKLHRLNGPALLQYPHNGLIERELWCRNGEYHITRNQIRQKWENSREMESKYLRVTVK